MQPTNLFSFKRVSLILFIIAYITFASSCKKPQDVVPEPETATVTDIQGHVYKTIKIGNQWWMADNLCVTQYKDGSSIFSASTIEEWKNDSSGTYCGNSENKKERGLLYNWYVVSNSKGIAPDGWRIPSDEDWKELEKKLGMSAEEANKTSWRGTHEGEKLMIQYDGTNPQWLAYGNVWATNESGFSARPAKCRLFTGDWGDAQYTAFFWSSTSQGSEAWYRYLDYKNANIFRFHGPKKYGFSIRCIKN